VKVLLLDVGNTRVKWGLGEDHEIHHTGHIGQDRIREQGLGVLTTRLPRKVDAVIAGNVAGQTLGTRLAGVIGAHTGCDLKFVTTTRSAGGVTNGYTRPRRLGVDRWLALIGAWRELGRACLVVDAGTAVTIDAMDGRGVHLGGQILPGTQLMAAALATNTAEIPPTPQGKAQKLEGLELFAKNTRTAVQSGSLAAVSGAVGRALRTLRAAERRAALVLTGGDAPRILAMLGESPLHRLHLVLHGLLELFELSASGAERRS
jgi:type III pantothenate kinase